MAEIKTKKTDENFAGFLNAIQDEGKRKDCFAIAEMMKDISKHEAKMWGPAIIGFGSYHYKYESGHEGDMCMIGFSPRKQNITLYISGGINNRPELMEKLGKYKTGKGCLHINKLSDVNIDVLNNLIKAAYTHMKNKYG
jgi:hypothetical protein